MLLNLICQVARPYFEDTLGRQFNRLKKARVTTTTYLDTHSDLLCLVLPSQPLLDAVAARGDWTSCQDAIQTLLAAGPLGKALFTWAGLAANAASLEKHIEALLVDISIGRDAFCDTKIKEFKAAAAAKTDEYQAV